MTHGGLYATVEASGRCGRSTVMEKALEKGFLNLAWEEMEKG